MLRHCLQLDGYSCIETSVWEIKLNYTANIPKGKAIFVEGLRFAGEKQLKSS